MSARRAWVTDKSRARLSLDCWLTVMRIANTIVRMPMKSDIATMSSINVQPRSRSPAAARARRNALRIGRRLERRVRMGGAERDHRDERERSRAVAHRVHHRDAHAPGIGV